MEEENSCICDLCIQCCSHSTGWFGSIGEVFGASKIMNMSLSDFAKEYLIREWWSGENQMIVIAPRKDFSRSKSSFVKEHPEEAEKNGKGFVKATWVHNLITDVPCIFLDENNRCKIHESKPQECRESFACRKEKFLTRELIADYWQKHQDFIDKLIQKINGNQ